MNVTTRVKRRAHISTAPVVPVWRPSAKGYTLAEAHQFDTWLAAERRRPLHYLLLPDHSVKAIVGPNAVLEWALEFENGPHSLGDTDIDGWRVSTIFMGVDGTVFDGPPILFETMVFTSATRLVDFGGRQRALKTPVDRRRYSTYDQAMQGHAECVTETRAIVAGMNKLKGQADEG